MNQAIDYINIFIEDYKNTKDVKYAFIIGVALYSLESWINECYYEQTIPDSALEKIEENLFNIINIVKTEFNVKRNGTKDFMAVNVWTPKGYIATINKNNNVIIKRK